MGTFTELFCSPQQHSQNNLKKSSTADNEKKGENGKKMKRIVNMLYLFYKKLTKKPLIRGKLSVPNGPILVNGE